LNRFRSFAEVGPQKCGTRSAWGRRCVPPPVSPARGPPADWRELVQVHDDRAIFQASPDELPVIDIRSL